MTRVCTYLPFRFLPARHNFITPFGRFIESNTCARPHPAPQEKTCLPDFGPINVLSCELFRNSMRHAGFFSPVSFLRKSIKLLQARINCLRCRKHIWTQISLNPTSKTLALVFRVQANDPSIIHIPYNDLCGVEAWYAKPAFWQHCVWLCPREAARMKRNLLGFNVPALRVLPHKRKIWGTEEEV